MAATKKNYAKVKVWGERCTVTMEGPLMPIIKQMFTSVPVDNQEYMIRELQKVYEDMKPAAE